MIIFCKEWKLDFHLKFLSNVLINDKIQNTERGGSMHENGKRTIKYQMLLILKKNMWPIIILNFD